MQEPESRQIPGMPLTSTIVTDANQVAALSSCAKNPVAFVPYDSVRSFTELIRHFEKPLYLVAVAIAADGQMAERIIFEATYRAFKSLRHDSRIEQQAKLFLIENVVSVGRDLVGIEEGDADTKEIPSSDRVSDLSGFGPHKTVVRETLTMALRTLPQLQRVVIVLRDCLRLTTVEISHILGIPRTNVIESLSQARFGVYKSFIIAELKLQDATAPPF